MLDEKKFVSHGVLRKILTKFEAYLAEATAPVLTQHRDRIRQLEARTKDLEATTLKFAGTFDPEKAYPENSVVRRSGSAWVCVKATSGAFNHDDWQLLIKRGDAA